MDGEDGFVVRRLWCIAEEPMVFHSGVKFRLGRTCGNFWMKAQIERNGEDFDECNSKNLRMK
ncbi:S ribonuclease [Pyrus ussuriensis x Pyrus communis]|uniref:S ribonuclease n=1 Tax=Pyrus ussuriensis x Pyrus communis TaxID=2448454 RepID=A0A5N5F3F3_9ROSA|nr:S ribonuclease [Pyrus ussuriensis x Pyrus communis]